MTNDATEEPLTVLTPYFKTPLIWTVSYYGYDVFSNMLDAIVDWCIDCLENDNQCVIIIRGLTGSGKSNLAMQIIKRILEKLKIEWVLEDMYIYSLLDLARKIERGSKNPINWYDEGSITFNSLNSTSEEGKLMGMFFDTMRIDHYISIIVLPSDKEVNARILKHANLFLECPRKVPLPDFSSRGFFEVYKRTTYKSGKYYDKKLGAGIFRPIPKRYREPYEALKRQKADEFKLMLAQKILKKSKKKQQLNQEDDLE